MLRSKQKRQKKTLRAIGEAVRLRRIALNFSQEELGAAAKMHRTYITDIEGGLRNISILTVLRLSQALQCPLSQLIADAEQFPGFGS